MKDFLESDLFKNIQSFLKEAWEKTSKALGPVLERISNISEPGRPVIIKAFVALIAVLTALSVGMIVIDSLEDKQQETTTTQAQGYETTLAQVQTTEPPQQDLHTNILFCFDDENDKIHLLMLADINSYDGRVKLLFIDPSSACQANEVVGNMNTHLKTGGVTQLALAVSEYTGVSVEKYLLGDEKAFVSLMKYIGDIEVNVEKSVSYSHDGLSYIIDKGSQMMTSDVILKYFIYLCNDTAKNGEKIKELCASFTKTLFDFNDSQQAQDNFGSVIGFFETNISAMDFSESKFAVIKLSHEPAQVLEVYNTLAEFNGIIEE